VTQSYYSALRAKSQSAADLGTEAKHATGLRTASANPATGIAASAGDREHVVAVIVTGARAHITETAEAQGRIKACFVTCNITPQTLSKSSLAGLVERHFGRKSRHPNGAHSMSPFS
jgi:hypothetical protein